MKYSVKTTKRFEKDVKRCIKRSYPMEKLKEVIKLLEDKGTLPPKYRPHKLSGNYEGIWECHITSDWLLMWQQDDAELILLFVSTGTHSDVF